MNDFADGIAVGTRRQSMADDDEVRTINGSAEGPVHGLVDGESLDVRLARSSEMHFSWMSDPMWNC